MTAGAAGAAPGRDRLVLISDLHLGGGAEAAAAGPAFVDRFDQDEALLEFLGYLGRRQDERVRLVLLGDTLDFLRVPVTGRRTGLYARNDAEAIGQLERIHAAHSAVFAGLAKLLANGAGVNVVVGNHDVELARPAVRARFRALLQDPHGCGPPALTSLRFHPWAYHVPGLLYAEHGNHYHDINTFTRPLHPFRAGGSVERPPAARLGGLRRLASGRGASVGLRDALADLLPRRRLNSATRSAYGRLLREYAEEVGLALDVVERLHQMGRTSVPRIARRLLRSHCGLEPSYPELLPQIAAAVHDSLSSRGQAARFYVFGHVHVPQYRRLPDGTASYLNTGTWSMDGPVPRPWVEITRAGTGSPTAALLRWAGVAVERPRPRTAGSGKETRVDEITEIPASA